MAVQDTQGKFTYSLVVVDNDRLESARAVVSAFAKSSDLPINYCCEPEQNIARARNRALEYATGDFVAFFDDDQLPPQQWLLSLLTYCETTGADGILGPVKPVFEVTPPKWVIKGRFCERPSHPTGFKIQGRHGRTGNVLLRRPIFVGETEAFRPAFLTGEDQDFFRRAIAKGYRFLWCEEAAVSEIVPAQRWNRRFMLRRALLRGKISLRHPGVGIKDLGASLLAVAAYSFILPFSLLGGQHRFMRYLVSLCDHLGRILELLRLNPIEEVYSTR